MPADVTDAAARYRYGRAGCRSTSRWTSRRAGRAPTRERLGRTAIVHVTPGLDGVSRAVNEAERGVAPRRGDDRRGPALRGRPVARSRGQVDRLDPAPGASRRPRERRCRRRARRRRRHLDGDASRGVRRSDRRAARRVDREPLVGHPEADRPLPGRPRGAQPPTWSPATSTRAAARSTRTSSGGRSRPRRGTARRSRASGTSGASTHPGPGLGAGSGYLVAKELTKPPLPRGSLQSFQDAREAVPLGDLHPERVVRGGRRGVRGGGVRRDRPLGDEAARTTTQRTARSCVSTASRSRTASPPCRPSSSSGSRAWRGRRSGGAHRGDLRVDRASRDVRAGGVLVLSGPLGRCPSEARAIVVDGSAGQPPWRGRRRAARLGADPPRAARVDGLRLLLADALALLDEAGLDEVGIMADTFNLAHEDTAEVVGRDGAIHGAARRRRAAGGGSRACACSRRGPGRSAELVAALREAGWDGTLDVEVFSTPEAFWSLPAGEAAGRAHAAVAALASAGCRLHTSDPGIRVSRAKARLRPWASSLRRAEPGGHHDD